MFLGPNKVAAFKAEYDAIIADAPTHEFRMGFVMRDVVALWLRDVRETGYADYTGSGTRSADIVNNAVMAAGLRQLALKHAVDLVPTDDDGNRMTVLPGMPAPFTERDLVDTVNGYPLIGKNSYMLGWTHDERGLSYDAALDDGLHILGAMSHAGATRLTVIDGPSRWPVVMSAVAAPPALPPFPARF